ncbi:hypothetical protein YC2023_097153 [Brassica napus]
MSSDIFCWNVRGLNKFSHRSGLRKWFRKNSPLFGGLLETHVKKTKMHKFVSDIFPGWSFDDNYGFSPLGKVWIIWHPSLLVSVIYKSLQMIMAEVTWPSCQSKFFISIIYASNDVDERVGLWEEIASLAATYDLDTKPWILLGDFNQIRDPVEHSSPPSLNMDKRIRDFNNCLINESLDDLNFRGTTFTWWNKQKSAPVAKKLDRCLVNGDWYAAFPSSVALFGSPDFSDHAVISVSLDPSRVRTKKPFRFYNFLNQNPDFLAMVCVNWFSFNVKGSAMFRLSVKLKMLKKCIRTFSHQNYSGIERKTAEAHAKLLLAQSAMLSAPNPLNASVELQAMKEWEELSSAEAAFFFQRAHINWITLGDGNSRLFHRYAASRQAHNHIHYLYADSGAKIDSQTGIENLCVGYFSDLLGSAVSQPMFVQSDLDLLFDFKCSEDQVVKFQAGFTSEDIRHAFFSLPKNKMGGPDGFTAEFYIAAWSVVGPEVTEAVLEFFQSGRLLKQWNAATLVLIPKKPNASLTTDFRPISCLNTVYKVISKLLASRLKDILPLMVSKSQSAFLPGRLLAENVILATDLVNGYNTQAISPRGMLKVDLRKAFDSVRWDFIIASLRVLAIPEGFISLISECISTASFSVSVNGSSSGYFKSTKGIRQGDPLSPYLFVLAMESLSRLLTSRYADGNINYHPRTEQLQISHLMFADDVMIFFDGSSNSLHGITECLDDFASWSGLHMNTSKTELFTAGLDPMESTAITGYGFPAGSFPIRYLGLPLMSRKLKISEYSPLINKITLTFQSWASKMLSFAGRLQLLRTVIFGTVTFWLSAFMLPKGCIQAIEALCARFLWSGNIDKRGLAKIAWSTVCLPKQEGGLGLRSFSVWNQVLCLKFIWLLLSKTPSLWVEWHWNIHLQDKSFWSIEASVSDSWAWKRLLKLRPLALQFCKTALGNGRSASFWFDVWTPLGQLITYLGPLGPRALRIGKNAVVADATRGSDWALPHPRSQQEVDLHSYLTTISLPLSHDCDDMFEWIAGDSSLCSFRSDTTWEVLRPREETKDWVDVVWFKGSVPKLAFTMWVANYDRLPTRTRLASWGIPISADCPFCSRDLETRDHVLLSCEYSCDVWREVLIRCNPPSSRFTEWSELLSWIRAATSKEFRLLRKLATHTVIFHLWKQRNNLIHNQTSLPATIVFRSIDREMRNIISAKRHRKGFSSLMELWLR